MEIFLKSDKIEKVLKIDLLLGIFYKADVKNKFFLNINIGIRIGI